MAMPNLRTTYGLIPEVAHEHQLAPHDVKKTSEMGSHRYTRSQKAHGGTRLPSIRDPLPELQSSHEPPSTASLRVPTCAWTRRSPSPRQARDRVQLLLQLRTCTRDLPGHP